MEGARFIPKTWSVAIAAACRSYRGLVRLVDPGCDSLKFTIPSARTACRLHTRSMSDSVVLDERNRVSEVR